MPYVTVLHLEAASWNKMNHSSYTEKEAEVNSGFQAKNFRRLCH